MKRVSVKEVVSPPQISLTDIVTRVSAEYGISEEELRELSRNCKLSEARAVIVWLIRPLGTASVKKNGESRQEIQLSSESSLRVIQTH